MSPSPKLLRDCTACEGEFCAACCGLGTVEARCYCGVGADLLDTASGEWVCSDCHDDAVVAEGAEVYGPALVAASASRIALRHQTSFVRKHARTDWPAFTAADAPTHELPIFSMSELVRS